MSKKAKFYITMDRIYLIVLVCLRKEKGKKKRKTKRHTEGHAFPENFWCTLACAESSFVLNIVALIFFFTKDNAFSNTKNIINGTFELRMVSHILQ